MASGAINTFHPFVGVRSILLIARLAIISKLGMLVECVCVCFVVVVEIKLNVQLYNGVV